MAYGVAVIHKNGEQGLVGFCTNGDWSRMEITSRTRKEATELAQSMFRPNPFIGTFYGVVPIPYAG